MSTKSIITRIKNKVDTLANWGNATGTLLNGEIAIVRVPTGETYTNPVTGATEPVVELLMKVGDGSSTFANLPWLSAKASDVYNWAKGESAEDIEISITKGSDTTASTDTLANWLKTTYDKGVTNAAGIASNLAAINIIKGSNTTAGSFAKAIKDAIEALDVSEPTASGTSTTFIATAKQENGKIVVTKKNLPTASTTVAGIVQLSSATDSSSEALAATPKAVKAAYDAGTDAQSRVGALETKLEGVTKVTTSITNAINNLDVSEPTASGTGTSFIATAKQEDGKIVVTKKNLPTASTSAAGIVKLGATGGAATFDAVDTLTTQVNTNKSDISDLKAAVAGGTHFLGEVSTAPSGTSVTIKGETTAKTVKVGDIVICGEKEYIYVAASTWKELGDLGRVGTLETWRNKLVKADTAVANQFVTEVDIASDGTVTINRAQPTSANIKHGDSSTVSATLSAHATEVAKLSDIGTSAKVGATIDSKISAAIGALDVDDPSVPTSGTTTSTTFIASISQTDGKISATKRNLPSASTSAAGIVKLNNTTTSTSTSEAATANAVKTAYDAGADAQSRVGALETKLEGVTKVTTSITNAIAALDFTAPTTTGDTSDYQFISSVSQTDGKITATKHTIPDATTSVKGVVKLSSSTSSTSEALAATPKAVKSAYDKGSDAQTRVGTVEGNYIRYNGDKLYVGKNGTDEIIFDCGGAPTA